MKPKLLGLALMAMALFSGCGSNPSDSGTAQGAGTTVKAAETPEGTSPSETSISRKISCVEVDTSYIYFDLTYEVGFGIRPSVSLDLAGTDLTPAGHTLEAGPVAMNGRADCGDRTQFCSEGNDSSQERTLQAPTEFVTFVAGTMWTIQVDSAIGKSKGTARVGDEVHNLNCEVTSN